jgi:hypothetical protein
MRFRSHNRALFLLTATGTSLLLLGAALRSPDFSLRQIGLLAGAWGVAAIGAGLVLAWRLKERRLLTPPDAPSPGRYAVQQRTVGGGWVTVRFEYNREEPFGEGPCDTFPRLYLASQMAEELQLRGLSARVVDRSLRVVVWPYKQRGTKI